MKSSLKGLAAAAAILFAAAAQAAPISTTWSVTNGTASFTSSGGISATGPTTLTNIGSGTFSATVSLTASNATAPFTITLSGGNTITGTLQGSLITQIATTGTGLGSATVTGGTGTYAGATGSFPSVAGSGSLSGTSISFSFSGTGTITLNSGGASGPPPTITAVQDAGSYTSSIAQGSIFVVKGTNLSASGFTQLSFPLPPSSGGVSINFTPLAGGTGIPAYLIYLYNVNGVNQLAAVLPSTVAAGSYNVTVTSGGQISAPFAASVVKQKPELITADSTGSGLAVVQNYVSATQLDVNRFTRGSVGGFTISAAYPGQTEIAYTIGLGADPVPDNQASPGYNFLANGVSVIAIVGGMNITPSYAGLVPGGIGYGQVNFVLPANVPTGCAVPFQISENGILSKPTFIAIAPNASSDACVQPGFTTSQLRDFDNGKVLYTGSFSIDQITETIPSLGTIKDDLASGGFIAYTGYQLPAIPPTAFTSFSNLSGCFVTQLMQTQQTQTSSGIGVFLDAGNLTLTGPSGSNLANTAFTETLNTYSLQIAEEGVPGLTSIGKLLPGTYTINGAGGKDVKGFTVSVNFPTPLTITGGLPTTVVRSAGLPLAWTGGNGSDLVEIAGSAETISSTGTITSGAAFVCFTTAGAGGYTVPSSILNQVPAVSAADIAANKAYAALEVFTLGTPAVFSAPLVAGGSIDNSTLFAEVGIVAQTVYQ